MSSSATIPYIPGKLKKSKYTRRADIAQSLCYIYRMDLEAKLRRLNGVLADAGYVLGDSIGDMRVYHHNAKAAFITVRVFPDIIVLSYHDITATNADDFYLMSTGSNGFLFKYTGIPEDKFLMLAIGYDTKDIRIALSNWETEHILDEL